MVVWCLVVWSSGAERDDRERTARLVCNRRAGAPVANSGPRAPHHISPERRPEPTTHQSRRHQRAMQRYQVRADTPSPRRGVVHRPRTRRIAHHQQQHRRHETNSNTAGTNHRRRVFGACVGRRLFRRIVQAASSTKSAATPIPAATHAMRRSPTNRNPGTQKPATIAVQSAGLGVSSDGSISRPHAATSARNTLPTPGTGRRVTRGRHSSGAAPAVTSPLDFPTRIGDDPTFPKRPTRSGVPRCSSPRKPPPARSSRR